MTIQPQTFAHVVYRTFRFTEMIAWYLAVFGAKVQYANDLLAFLTYDHEHHRIALLNLETAAPPDTPRQLPRAPVGVDHVAYGFASLGDLLGKYGELKAKGIRPYWCLHHGITISLYYADPDGNQMEFQVDCFGTHEEANAFLNGPKFALNPVGVEFDPDDWLTRLSRGEPEASFFPRKVDLPVAAPRASSQATRRTEVQE